MTRPDGRSADEIRPVSIERGVLASAEGSCTFATGGTRVLCTASVAEEVPRWFDRRDRGWVTAEYEMHPASTDPRKPREGRRGHVGGRTKEIQRLIGRALRAVCDLEALGPRTIWLDCEVLEADGGTRCASIAGAYVALAGAVRDLSDAGRLAGSPLRSSLQAISVGIVDGEPRLDLSYAEDVSADVDMNVALTGDGGIVEIQGTAEGDPFTSDELGELLDLARTGCAEIAERQRVVLEEAS